MCGGVSGSLAFVGGDGKDLLAPGDDGSDGNLALISGVLCGEQGAAHHGEVVLSRVVNLHLWHEADDSSPQSLEKVDREHTQPFGDG